MEEIGHPYLVRKLKGSSRGSARRLDRVSCLERLNIPAKLANQRMHRSFLGKATLGH